MKDKSLKHPEIMPEKSLRSPEILQKIQEMQKIPTKFISFGDTSRGHTQVKKEFNDGWTVRSIKKLGQREFICELEKLDRIRSLIESFSIPLYSKTKLLATNGN